LKEELWFADKSFFNNRKAKKANIYID